MMQRLVLVLLVAGLCLSMLAKAEKLEFHSFEPPFEEVDYGGDRMVRRNPWLLTYLLTHSSLFAYRLAETGVLLVRRL